MFTNCFAPVVVKMLEVVDVTTFGYGKGSTAATLR